MTQTINNSLAKQREFFNMHKTKNIDFRIKQLKKLKSAIIEYEPKINAALFKDLHKCEMDSYTSEIGFCLNEISHAIKNLKKWAKPKKVKSPKLFYFSKGFVVSEPFGVSLIIGPWNYPFGLIISPLIGAISAGNCAVIKPSEISNNTALVLQEMMDKYFNEEYISVVQGDASVSQSLLKEKFDYIFFTGGELVGKIVMRAAAENLTPLTLELGGKSPCIIDKECNLEKTASRVIWGKFLNAGQTCIAPDYLLVHKDIKEDLVKSMKEKIVKFYGENPSKSKEYGRIINKYHFNRLSDYLKDGKVISGGKTSSKELYIAPTIIVNAPLESKIMQEEIFGPILPLIEYSDIDRAIEFINSRPKPLAMYIFSRNKKLQNKIINKTSSGGVCVNDTLIHITSTDLPFGGVGTSGIGKYHGKYSFETFSNKRSVLRHTTLFDMPRFPPYDKIGLKIVKNILK